MKSTNKAFYKMVLALVIPMALQNLINVAVTSADVVMLAKVSDEALSGSSLAGQVQFVMMLFFFGITSGSAVLIAQYWGKGETRTIEKIMGIALRIAILVSLLFTIGVLVFTVPIMSLLTKEEEIIIEGVKYLRIVAISYPLIAFTMVYLNTMRSIERVMISTVVYLISLVVNIILNAILIFGLFGAPALGIQGAAIATVTARLTEVLMVCVYAKKNNKVVRLRLKDLFIKDAILKEDFMKYASPVIANELLWGAAGAVNTIIIGHIATPVIAANAVAQVARQLATVVAFGIASAAAIIVGKTIGEKNDQLATQYANRFIKLSIYAGICGGLVILAIRPVVLSYTSISLEAKGYLSAMMYVMSYFVVAQSLNATFVVGISRAGGDTKFGLYLDVLSMWGGSILLGVLATFVFKWPVTVIYILLMSDELIKIPFTLYRYKGMKWLNNVTRGEV